jgi:hypothetical protein
MSDAATRQVIVSLTTISSRAKHIDAIIASLQAQDAPPTKIVLNISDHPYLLDEGIEFADLPPTVRKLAVSGAIELNFVRNLGSYRKLLPTLRRYKDMNCLIVTADDDATYPRHWLSGLVEAFDRHGCVAAYRARHAVARNGALRPYAEWSLIIDDKEPTQQKFYTEPQMNVFPTGRGGVLYHPSFFPDMALLDRFRNLAPAQDDLAFRMATFLAGVPVIAVPFAVSGAKRSEFGGPPVSSELWKQNLPIAAGISANDAALRAILGYCRESGLLKDENIF